MTLNSLRQMREIVIIEDLTKSDDISKASLLQYLQQLPVLVGLGLSTKYEIFVSLRDDAFLGQFGYDQVSRKQVHQSFLIDCNSLDLILRQCSLLTCIRINFLNNHQEQRVLFHIDLEIYVASLYFKAPMTYQKVLQINTSIIFI